MRHHRRHHFINLTHLHKLAYSSAGWMIMTGVFHHIHR